MKRFFIAVNVSYLSCGFVLMVNRIRLGGRARNEKYATSPRSEARRADEQHQKPAAIRSAISLNSAAWKDLNLGGARFMSS
jgi:hypothetical protein